MSLKEIVSSKKFYQLQLCSLCDSSYDHIFLLLAEFIKRGVINYFQDVFLILSYILNKKDFSKVNHSCERNNAFKDINQFKDYISNLTKEGKEEEKSLIVYKLDEILDVTKAEDEQLENKWPLKYSKLQMQIQLILICGLYLLLKIKM